jgi:hypothetical protein
MDDWPNNANFSVTTASALDIFAKNFREMDIISTALECRKNLVRRVEHYNIHKNSTAHQTRERSVPHSFVVCSSVTILNAPPLAALEQDTPPQSCSP